MNLRPTLAVLFAACLCAPLLRAGESGSPFTDDLAAARARAKEQHRDVLVDFTGSDWCGWCKILDKEVFLTPEFKAKAPELFELVQLDYPSDKVPQTAEVKARNNAWREELHPGGFPDVLLLDETGLLYAKTGYRAGGAAVYLKHLEELRSRRVQRDEAMAKAKKAAGVEKAKHLDAALSALRNRKLITANYGALIKEVMALDSKNEAGLKAKYAVLLATEQCTREINGICGGKDKDAMQAQLKAYAARKDISAEARQYAFYMAAAVRSPLGKPEKIALAKQALAQAPEDPLVEESIRPLIDQLEKKH